MGLFESTSSQIAFVLSLLAIVLYCLPRLHLLRHITTANNLGNGPKPSSSASCPVYMIIPKERLSQAAQDSLTAQLRSQVAPNPVGISGNPANGIAFWTARLTPAQVTLFEQNPFVWFLMDAQRPLFPAPAPVDPSPRRDEYGNELLPDQVAPSAKETKLHITLRNMYGPMRISKREGVTLARSMKEKEARKLEYGPSGPREYRNYLIDKLNELSGLGYSSSLHETVTAYVESHWDVKNYCKVQPKVRLAEWTEDLIRRGFTESSPSNPSENVSLWDTSSPNFHLNEDLRSWIISTKAKLTQWEVKLKGKKIVVAADFDPQDSRHILYEELPQDMDKILFYHRRFWTPGKLGAQHYLKDRINVKLNEYDVVKEVFLG